MSFLSFLGSLPASSSIKGKLDGLDYKKLARMGVVLVGSYITVAVAEKLMVDLAAWPLPDDAEKLLMMGVALVLEWGRRKYAEATPSA